MSERTWDNVKLQLVGKTWEVYARIDSDEEWIQVESYFKLADAEQLADELENDDDKREELIDTALEEDMIDEDEEDNDEE